MNAITHKIEVVDTGEEFDCDELENLLQGMRKFRIGEPLIKAIPIGCRGGGCGICRIKVLKGYFEAQKMSFKHVTTEDKKEGIALACRVYPHSDLRIEVLSRPKP